MDKKRKNKLITESGAEEELKIIIKKTNSLNKKNSEDLKATYKHSKDSYKLLNNKGNGF